MPQGGSLEIYPFGTFGAMRGTSYVDRGATDEGGPDLRFPFAAGAAPRRESPCRTAPSR